MSLPSIEATFRIATPSLKFLPPLIVIALFLGDFWSPFELAIPMYYVAALLLVVALPQRREKYSVALICTTLALVDYILAPGVAGAPGWLRILNHVLSVIVIWAVVVLGLRHTRSLDALRASERTRTDALLSCAQPTHRLRLGFVSLTASCAISQSIIL